MAGTFIGQLNDRLAERRQTLKSNLSLSVKQDDAQFQAEVSRHWHSPLPEPLASSKRPAYAIDGSSRRANLTNGSTVFVAQALIMGEDLNQPITDIEILPGTVRAQTMDRFADLMRQSLEIGLAREYAGIIPEGSILYLDGALYGSVTQLYPLQGAGIPDDRDFAAILRKDFHLLFELAEKRNIKLISIAKTNRQPLFSKIIQLRMGRAGDSIREISDSAVFDGMTDRRIGYSTPIELGTFSFSAGSETVVLEGADLKSEPAIVSFYVRLADLDDALRVDLLAPCIGRRERLGDVGPDGFELLEPESIVPIIQLLQSDYGGVQVYNALAYVTDLEVRLTKQKMYDIYLPMVAEVLGEELRIDRSERRFVE